MNKTSQHNPLLLFAKERFIKETAEVVGKPFPMVDDLISWVYSETTKATKTNGSVELPDLGKLLFCPKKAEKKIITYKKKKEELESRLHDPSISDLRKRNAMIKAEGYMKHIKMIEDRILNISSLPPTY